MAEIKPDKPGKADAAISPGVCPKCGTALDHDEIIVDNGWFEAFCCMCSRYYRKARRG